LSDAPWWRHLRGDPARFLLDEREPGAVWRALVELLGRPPDSPAVERARLASRQEGAAAHILERQDPLGFWGSPTAYGRRWEGSAWQLLGAVAFGADPHDSRVCRGLENLLSTLRPRAGGFAITRDSLPSACFTAEVCAAMVRCGFAHHPRVREAVAWLMAREGTGGWSCPDLRHLVDGKCPVAAVGALRVAADAPVGERARLSPLSDRAGRWLLSRGLLMDGPAPGGWKRFAYPRLNRADLLQALSILARLAWPPGEELARALLLVLGRQDECGRWLQESGAPFGEPCGGPSRWVTLEALVSISVYGDSLMVGGEG
jgi:hypothetical protein